MLMVMLNVFVLMLMLVFQDAVNLFTRPIYKLHSSITKLSNAVMYITNILK